MFQRIWDTKKFMHKKGITLFSVEFYFSLNAKKTVFQKIVASKNDNLKGNCSSMITITFFNKNCIDLSELFGDARRRFTKMFRSTVDKSGKNWKHIYSDEVFCFFTLAAARFLFCFLAFLILLASVGSTLCLMRVKTFPTNCFAPDFDWWTILFSSL